MNNKNNIAFLNEINSDWVIETFHQMTLDEKIGQLFQVAAFSNRDDDHVKEITQLIEKYHLGGLTFFQGTIDKQVELTNTYQKLSKVPLFINMDAEWGLGMRLKDGLSFPYQMTLGAIQDNQLIYQFGEYIGKECRKMGVSSPLAPVVDINNNSKNPVINYRSFGGDKENVANKGIAYIKGLQSQHVLDNAKHFPGHGDTAVDSHLDMPVLNHSDEHLREVELYPFKKLIDEGLSSVMSAHLQIEAWESKENTPSTLSSKVLNGILKEDLGFDGLVITDAMDMQGITKYYKNGTADAMAILAGNHVITNSKDVGEGVAKIKEFLKEGKLTEKVLDEAVLKILAMKKWVGLHHHKTITYSSEVHKNDGESIHLLQKLSDKAVTSLKGEIQKLNVNSNNVFLQLHIKNETKSIRDEVAHHLKDVDVSTQNPLCDYFNHHQVPTYIWSDQNKATELFDVIEKSNQYDRIFVSIFGINKKPLNNFDLPKELSDELFKRLDKDKVTYIHLGNAFALDELQECQKSKEILLTYQDLEALQRSVTKVFDAHLIPDGKLAVELKNYKQL
ncbi:hypothetical protein KMW28_22185 [Flammeovirga yaeyamensis]|uniref:beta-N-acetylhexosaminidase n=1 Tax=Flammeovirga yaeyamensis TaxID=367791 RepID=A0AAX1NDR5_9BACT|nr:glycoside hydrolase family 3 N-terminal domain-containing protein [Flammeovirga yaeyamensis]MBB3696933.1 beta-glucosidase-like glycosyl hydrolase [Flammeovirga yaeyamensis]NMF33596.1 hypothetical protein [Flammeovirga yaeyamensis]QWG05136.1 hypothetical protein KMW28_22185 [Flammeovirga yaeyamensis]